MFIDVTTTEQLEEVKKLIQIKKKRGIGAKTVARNHTNKNTSHKNNDFTGQHFPF